MCKVTAKDFKLNQVIICGEVRGWVRYIGPICIARKQSTIWLGIEWFKDERGKHDGSVTDKDGKVSFSKTVEACMRSSLSNHVKNSTKAIKTIITSTKTSRL